MFGYVSKKTHQELRWSLEKVAQELEWERKQQHERVLGLERMNARLQADMDWAKHRLNQVERERAQLIAAAIGVKVAVPEFVPTYRPDEALNEGSDPFKGVGEDSPDPKDQFTPSTGEGVDYSMMPGYKGN